MHLWCVCWLCITLIYPISSSGRESPNIVNLPTLSVLYFLTESMKHNLGWISLRESALLQTRGSHLKKNDLKGKPGRGGAAVAVALCRHKMLALAEGRGAVTEYGRSPHHEHYPLSKNTALPVNLHIAPPLCPIF